MSINGKWLLSLLVVLGLVLPTVMALALPSDMGSQNSSFPPLVKPLADSSGNLAMVQSGPTLPSVTGSIPLGFDGLSSITVDTSNGYLYGINTGSEKVSVVNITSNSLETSISLGQQPSDIAYDSLNGEIYVAEQHGIAVINTTRNSVIANLVLNSSPLQIIFDSITGMFYASISQSSGSAGYLLSINGTTNSINAKVTGFISPMGMAVNLSSGNLFVADQVLQGIEVVNVTSNTIVQNVNFGIDAMFLSYDSSNGYVFLSSGDVLSLVNTHTWRMVWNATVGGGIFNLAYDSRTGNVYAGGFTSSYLFVVNATTGNAINLIQINNGVNGLCYDPVNGRVYASSIYALNVIDDKTNQVVYKLDPGIYPGSLAYDIKTDQLFVSNSQNSRLQVLNSTMGKQIGNIGLQGNPTEVLADPATGKIFVTVSGTNQLCIFSDSTYSLLKTIRTGTNPWGMVLDPTRQMLYVMNTNSENITVVNASSGNLAYSVFVGYYPNQKSAPYEGAWDSFNHNVYFTNMLQNDVLVLNTSTDQISLLTRLQSIPSGIAFDSQNRNIYVSLAGDNNVSVINTGTHSTVGNIPVGKNPNSILFNPYSGYLFTANENSNNVSVINGSLNRVVESLTVGEGPEALAYGNSSGNVYVSDYYSNNLSVIGWNNYNVRFNESGLSSGAWYINITGTETFQSGPLDKPMYQFSLPVGSYHYMVGSTGASQATPGSGNFTVVDSGYSLSIVFKNVSRVPGYGILTTPLFILAYLVAISAAALVYNIKRRKR